VTDTKFCSSVRLSQCPQGSLEDIVRHTDKGSMTVTGQRARLDGSNRTGNGAIGEMIDGVNDRANARFKPINSLHRPL
jgi:hypothetical protein